MTVDPTRKALAEFALAAGHSPDSVERAFGADTLAAPTTSLGQRAQERLDAFLRDPDWMARYERGEMEARDQYNALTVAIAWQQGQDRAAQYQSSQEGIAKQEAARAVEKAEADHAAARAQQESTANT